MKKFFMHKAAGFYPAFLGTVLAVIALICYIPAPGAQRSAEVFMVLAILVQIADWILSARWPGRQMWNLLDTAAAVLAAASLSLSVSTQLDNLGNLVSGLFSVGDMLGYLQFLGFGIAAMLLYIVASFLEQSR